MDMAIVCGPRKLSLQAIIDHRGPSLYSGYYTTSANCCKNILQRQVAYGVWHRWYQNSPTAYAVMYELIT